MKSLTTRLVVGVAAGFFVSTLASAETIRWARAGDSLTMEENSVAERGVDKTSVKENDILTSKSNVEIKK